MAFLGRWDGCFDQRGRLRQELGDDEVAGRGMDLYSVELGGFGHRRRGNELTDDFEDLQFGQGTGRDIAGDPRPQSRWPRRASSR